MRVLIFLQGTILMHAGAVGHSREERVAQSRGGSEPTLHDSATYVPVGHAVAKIRRWRDQGARISYLTSNRDSVKVAQDKAVLKEYGFPEGPVIARGPGENYGDVVGRELPDALVEDDCESIGTEEIAFFQIRPELRTRIQSIVVPEFGGIDHLPNSLGRLLTLGRYASRRLTRSSRRGGGADDTDSDNLEGIHRYRSRRAGFLPTTTSR